MHLVLKAVSVIVMIAGFFVLDVEPDQILIAAGGWLQGERLDRLAGGVAVIGLGSLIWYISTRLEPKTDD